MADISLVRYEPIYRKWTKLDRWGQGQCVHYNIAGLVVNYGISNTIVLEIP